MKSNRYSLSHIGARLQNALAKIDSGDMQGANRIYRQLRSQFPTAPGIRHLYGLALLETNKPEKARAELEAAVGLDPDNPVYQRGLADCLAALKQPEQALAAYKAAAARGLATDCDLLIGMGNAFFETGDLESSAQCYLQVIKKDPENKRALNNLGKLYHARGQLESAIEIYHRALEVDPVYPAAHFNLSMSLLLSGDYNRGWQEYQWRFACHGASIYPHDLDGPHWNGKPFRGRLLVHAEQGYGDMLFFARYLPWAKKRVGTLILEAHQPLTSLLGRMPSVDKIVPFSISSKPDVDYDFKIPIGSLPWLCLENTNTNSVENVPYLKTDTRRHNFWKSYLACGEGLRVGLVWATSGIDKKRDIPTDLLTPLTRLDQIRFFSLQKGPAAGIPLSSPLSTRVRHLGGMIRDFDDTAALCSQLDLLISTDTAAANLAGALGVPLWVLLPAVPDWRWHLDTDTCKWYPSARLFRQPQPGNWEKVIDKLVEALRDIQTLSLAGTGSKGTCQHGVQARQLLNKACSLIENKNYTGAIERLDQALKAQPDFAEAWFNLGYIYQCLDRLEHARQAYEQACRCKPDLAPAFVNRGVVLSDLGHKEKAETCFNKALEIEPGRADAHYNLGNLYLEQGHHEHAVAHFIKALETDDRHFRACGNLGRTYHEMGNYCEAEKWYKKALAINPNYAEAHLNLGVLYLLQNKYEQGWQQYEWRFATSYHKKIYPHRLRTPRWDGSDLTGRTILVHTEQGIGDCLQFVRYLVLLKKTGARIVFEARSSMAKLLEPMPFIDQVAILDSKQSNENGVDCHIPLLSLPLVFKTSLNNIPAQVPYISADPLKLKTWRSRIDSARPKVGLAWGGNDTYRNRSLSFTDLEQIMHAFPQVAFYGLQKGPAAAQADNHPMLAANLGPAFEDFSDTAAVVELLDLVISIDTAVAHLAGAMAKPVWVLLPRFADWRWGLDGDQSPWYPTMRLFRQNQPGRWSDVVENITNMLAGFFSRFYRP